MAIAITRLDVSAVRLREAAARTQDAKAARRTLAIALVLDGVVAGGGRRGLRNGSADLAGLGSSLQRVGA